MDDLHQLSCNSLSQGTGASVDRRSAHTRQKLRQALSGLLLRRKYDGISVAHLCRAARVGRSTFYLHYAGKDDLKLEGIKLLRNEILATLRASKFQESPELRFSLPILLHAKAHAAHYHALAGSKGVVIALEALRETVRLAAKQELYNKQNHNTPSLPPEFAVALCVDIFMAFLIRWLESGMHETPEAIDQFYQASLTKGVLPATKTS